MRGTLSGIPALSLKDRRRAQAKGQRLERTVQLALEAQGAKVERAPKIVRWKAPEAPGERPRPFTVHHDYFNCADLLVFWPDGRRSLIQVTTLANVAARRVKFLASGLKLGPQDAILAHQGGQTWRELVGPDFRMPGRVLRLPAQARGGATRAASSRRGHNGAVQGAIASETGQSGPQAGAGELPRPAEPVAEEQVWIGADGSVRRRRGNAHGW